MPGVDFARAMLTGIAVTQGVATLLIDLGRTHATNPRWTGHARFHLVWQVSNLSLFAIVETALIWWRGPYSSERFYLAAVLTCISMLGFFAALASRKLYGGTLYDENGILPLRIRLKGRLVQLEMNTVVVAFALFLLVFAVVLFVHGQS
jgi:hypothetical protein